MRLLVWLVRAALFFLLFAFALNNQHEASIRWFFGHEWRTPMVFVVLVAFAMGWFTHWLLHRFTRVKGGDMAEMDKLAQSLHEAEELRDQALAYLEQREDELTNHISQTEAELKAAMEGLRDARHEAEEMRAYIERMHANG